MEKKCKYVSGEGLVEITEQELMEMQTDILPTEEEPSIEELTGKINELSQMLNELKNR